LPWYAAMSMKKVLVQFDINSSSNMDIRTCTESYNYCPNNDWVALERMYIYITTTGLPWKECASIYKQYMEYVFT
jgi:hypothetical protein